MDFFQYPPSSIVDLFENKHTHHQDRKIPYINSFFERQD